jgi:subtilisin family serine protease
MSSELAADYKLAEVDAWPITALGVHCVVFQTTTNQPVNQLIQQLSHDKRVESVQRMYRFHVLGDPYFRLQQGLHLMRIDEAHHWATGRDVTVAIIDTGADIDHPDLKGQITEHEDLVADKSSNFVDDLHGTAVAGVIAAIADNDEGIVGIAPDTKLIVLKACWQETIDTPMAVCNSLTLAKALDRAIVLTPDVLNLSLTGPLDPLLVRLVHEAMKDGIVIVGSDPGSAYHLDHEFPTSIAGVIPVRTGNTPGRPAHHKIDASQIYAPGKDVLTTFPHGDYNFLSGSSLAAAHVSGVVALLLELKPALSAGGIAKILRPVGNNAEPVLVNACAAIAKVRRSVRCGTAVGPRVIPEMLRADSKTFSTQIAKTKTTSGAFLRRRF